MSNVAVEAPLANSLSPPSSATAPVESPAEAEQLMVHLLEVMEALLGIVERETERTGFPQIQCGAQCLEQDQ